MKRDSLLFLHFKRSADGGEETIVSQLISEYSEIPNFRTKVIFYNSPNWQIQLYNLVTYYIGVWRYIYIGLFILFFRIKYVHISNYFPLLNPIFLAGLRFFGVDVLVHFHNHKLTCPIGTHWNKGKICFKCVERKSAIEIFRNECKSHPLVRLIYFLNFTLDSFAFRILSKNITVLTLTSWYGSFVAERKGIKSKHLPNSINPLIFDFRANKSEEIFFVYVGRDSDSKGYSDFLEVASNFCNIKFVSIGPKSSTTGPMNLTEYGWLSREETYKILARSTCLIAPYKGLETFGMTILESLALGVPVLTTDIYAVKELFSGRKGVYMYERGTSLSACIENYLDEIIDLSREDMYREFDNNYSQEIQGRSLMKFWKSE